MRTTMFMLLCALLALATAHAQPAGGGGDDNRILHKQVLHQYIVQEAFKILQSAAPRAAVKLQDHIGDMTVPAAPWSEQTITAGAHREDEEDICYLYGGPIIGFDPDVDMWHGNCVGQLYYEIESALREDPSFRDGLVTATHFWDPDATDTWLRFNNNAAIAGTGLFSCIDTPNFWVTIKAEANAMMKARRMMEPNNTLALQDMWWEPAERYWNELGQVYWTLPSVNDQTLPLNVAYTTLANLYNTGQCSLNIGMVGPTPGFVMTETQRDRFVWEILGRTCHLLTDMSVPAHIHKDIHTFNFHGSYSNWLIGDVDIDVDDFDSYEQWVAHAGDGDVGNLSSIHWTAEMILTQYPTAPFIDPTNEQDPLYFLMNSMRALAASFASDDFDGTGGHGLPVYTTDFPFLHNVDLDPPSSQVAVLSNIRDVTVPFCIRAVAGLLYWFANQLHREDDIYVYNTGVPAFSDFFYSEDPTNPS